MARSTIHTIRCDAAGIGCRTAVEVDSKIAPTSAPKDWICLVLEKDEAYSLNEEGKRFEFCSLRCVERWSAARRKALAPARAQSQEGDGGAIITTLTKVMRDYSGPMLVSEIETLTGLNKSTIHRYLSLMIDKGTVIETETRRGPYGARYQLRAQSAAA